MTRPPFSRQSPRLPGQLARVAVKRREPTRRGRAKRTKLGQAVLRMPARSLEKFKEQYAWFARLPELAERVRRLERMAGAE